MIVKLSEQMRVLQSFELMIHSLVVRSSVIASIIEAVLRMKKIMGMVSMIVCAHIQTVLLVLSIFSFITLKIYFFLKLRTKSV